MDFKDQIKVLAERVIKLKENLQTEEATKTALIMPFIQALGYDIFDPTEVIPEYTCDLGIKKGEKIDYAICQDNAPIILVECKHWKENLDAHNSQLFRYFHVSKARFGILTNGIIYRFYTDLVEKNKQLATVIGNDYLVAPDVIIYRNLCEDAEINHGKSYVDMSVATMADLRKSNGGKPILHASVSAKWTMRSDRAQNSRTEALNLIRNRKGHLPHIVVVTGEPLPSRLASLALGTGDLDCVYHFALYELLESVREYGANGREDIVETLENLIAGKRLKDISDLPLDLSV